MAEAFSYLVMIAASLVLTLSGTQACDCKPCQQYSEYYKRCECCVYIYVGGKRSVASSLPSYPVSDSKDILEQKEDFLSDLIFHRPGRGWQAAPNKPFYFTDREGYDLGRRTRIPKDTVFLASQNSKSPDFVSDVELLESFSRR